MTKEITKAYVLQQMQDKFKLRDLIPETFSFQETVVPVYNIEQHLEDFENFKKTLSITSTGGKLIFTVSKDKRYIIHGYTVVFMAAGAYKVAGVYLMRVSHATNFVYLDLTKNQVDSYTVNLPKPLVMHSGDALYINIDDYTSTADLQVTIDYSLEIVR